MLNTIPKGLLAGLCLALPWTGPAQEGLRGSFLGKRPPELVVPENGWLNWKGGEISISKLRGHVVWLEFSFLH